jgi:peptide/nickel transport system permease protein
MINYILRRLVSSIPVLIGVVAVTFILARLIPGDSCTAMLGEKATKAVCDHFNHEKGFDRPVLVQFGFFTRDVLRGDLGESIRFKRSVVQIIVERLPMTIELGLVSLLIATLVGIPAGILSALRRNSAIDMFTMVGANVGVSMPVFWLGLMLAYVFALLLKGTPFWLPPSGRLSSGIASIPFYEVYHWSVTKDTLLFRFFYSSLQIYLSSTH